MTKNNCFVGMSLGYDNKQIALISNTKFLGIVIDNSLSKKVHIEHILPKLSAACYAFKSVESYISLQTL